MENTYISTFKLYFTVVTGDNDPDYFSMNADRPRHILMADDDDDDFDIFSLAVAEMPMRIMLSRVVDGEQLMRQLNVSVPDILFLDIVMPCKDGRECLSEIRSDPRFDKLPIIIYTSMEDVINIEYCFKEKSNMYTIKPSRLVELTATLRRVLTINWGETMYFPEREDFVVHPEN